MSPIIYYCHKGKLLIISLCTYLFSANKWIASIYPSAVVNCGWISISCCQLWVNIHQIMSTVGEIHQLLSINCGWISISCCQLWMNIHQLLSTVVGIWRNMLRNHYKEFKGKHNRVEGLPHPSPWTRSLLWNPQPANRLSVSVPFFHNPDFDVAEDFTISQAVLHG